MNQLEILKILASRYIIIFGGQYGRGKSLSETALCFFISILRNKHKIVSNMPLKYPMKSLEIIHLNSTSQFDLNRIVKNSIYCWDELHNDLKARDFMNEKNKFVNNIAVAFRKDKVILIGSLQFFDTLELIIGEMLDVIIIPSYINTYSKDSNEDLMQRLERKDFWIRWDIIDRKTNEEYELNLNLYWFLKMYNTNFKPFPLILNHENYMNKNKIDKPKKYELIVDNNKQKMELSINNYNEGLTEILEKCNK